MKSNKALYRRHSYSGPRKSWKLVKAAIKRAYGPNITSRSVVWRLSATVKPVYRTKIKKKITSAHQNNGSDLPETSVGQSQIDFGTVDGSDAQQHIPSKDASTGREIYKNTTKESPQNTKNKNKTDIVPRQSTRIATRKIRLEEEKKRELEILAEKKKKENDKVVSTSLKTSRTNLLPNTSVPTLTETNSNDHLSTNGCNVIPAMKWVTEVRAYPILWSTEMVRYSVPWDYDGQTTVTTGSAEVRSSVNENSGVQTPSNVVFQPHSNVQFRSPQNVVFRPPSYGEVRSPSNVVFRPPFNGEARSPSNVVFRPPSNGVVSSPNVVFRPPSNVEVRSPQNVVFRPPFNGEVKSPSNAVFRPPCNVEMRSPQNVVFRPPCNGVIRAPNIVFQPPSNVEMRSPQNVVFKPPSNGVVRSPQNVVVRPPSNGSFRSSSNGVSQCLSNGEYQSPSNGVLRSASNGSVQSPLNGNCRSANAEIQTPLIIGAKDIESLKTLGIKDIPSLLIKSDGRAQTPLKIGNTGVHVPLSAANSPLIGTKVLQSLMTTGITDTALVTENGDQSAVVIRYIDSEPPQVNETLNRTPALPKRIEAKTTTGYKESESPIIIKNIENQPLLVTNSECQSSVVIETPLTGNAKIGSMNENTATQPLFISNNENEIPIVIEIIDAERLPTTDNTEIGALVNKNTVIENPLATNNESQTPVVIETQSPPFTGSSQNEAPSVTTNTETPPFILTDNARIEYIDAEGPLSTGNVEIGAHSTIVNAQTHLVTDKGNDDIFNYNSNPIIIEYIDNQTPCSGNTEIKTSNENMKAQPLVFSNKNKPLPQATTKEKVKLPKPKVVKNKNGRRKKNMYAKFRIPHPILTELTDQTSKFLQVKKAKHLKTYPVRKKMVQTAEEGQSPMITDVDNETPTRNNSTEDCLTIDNSKEVHKGPVKDHLPTNNEENYTETCNIQTPRNYSNSEPPITDANEIINNRPNNKKKCPNNNKNRSNNNKNRSKNNKNRSKNRDLKLQSPEATNCIETHKLNTGKLELEKLKETKITKLTQKTVNNEVSIPSAYKNIEIQAPTTDTSITENSEPKKSNQVEESGLQIPKVVEDPETQIRKGMIDSGLQIPNGVEESEPQISEAVEDTGLRIPNGKENSELQTHIIVEDSGLQKPNTLEDLGLPIGNTVADSELQKPYSVDSLGLQISDAVDKSEFETHNAVEDSRLQTAHSVEDTSLKIPNRVEDSGFEIPNLVEDLNNQILKESKKPSKNVVIKKSQLKRPIVIRKSELQIPILLRKPEIKTNPVIGNSDKTVSVAKNSEPQNSVINSSEPQTISMTGNVELQTERTISAFNEPETQASTNENIDSQGNGRKRKVKSRKLSPVRRPNRKKQVVSKTANKILEARVQSVIAKTYLYLSQEYKDLKKTYGGQLDLTSLAKFRRQMAKVTGLSQQAVNNILEEDKEQNASTHFSPREETLSLHSTSSEQSKLPAEMETDKTDEKDEKDLAADVAIKDEIDTKEEINESKVPNTEIPKSSDDDTLVKLEKIHAEEDCSYFVVL